MSLALALLQKGGDALPCTRIAVSTNDFIDTSTVASPISSFFSRVATTAPSAAPSAAAPLLVQSIAPAPTPAAAVCTTAPRAAARQQEASPVRGGEEAGAQGPATGSAPPGIAVRVGCGGSCGDTYAGVQEQSAMGMGPVGGETAAQRVDGVGRTNPGDASPSGEQDVDMLGIDAADQQRIWRLIQMQQRAQAAGARQNGGTAAPRKSSDKRRPVPSKGDRGDKKQRSITSLFPH